MMWIWLNQSVAVWISNKGMRRCRSVRYEKKQVDSRRLNLCLWNKVSTYEEGRVLNVTTRKQRLGEHKHQGKRYKTVQDTKDTRDTRDTKDPNRANRNEWVEEGEQTRGEIRYSSIKEVNTTFAACSLVHSLTCTTRGTFPTVRHPASPSASQPALQPASQPLASQQQKSKQATQL